MESEGLAQTDGRGSRSQVVYDAQGRVAKTIDALGHETTYGYDALGRQISVIDPLTNIVYTTYDAEGRILSQRGATYPVDYGYDVYGNKISMTTYRDNANRVEQGHGRRDPSDKFRGGEKPDKRQLCCRKHFDVT